MFEVLDKRRSLTGNQKRIVTAAILGDMLEFFDYFLIGFVLAFVVGPWKLTFLQSAIVLLSSGIGAMVGAAFWGWMADKIGRRPVFNFTILNFSLATGALYFTPDNGWIYLTLMRTVVGFGVGGLYCVDLPLVQEFMPASKRGFVGGLVTAFIPVGVMIGSLLGGYLAPEIGWRGLFAVGVLPGLAVLVVRMWVPESPRWLLRQDRIADAKKSLAWALEIDPAALPDPTPAECESTPTRFLDLFKYPRSLFVSWFGNLGAQTGAYGVILWAPTFVRPGLARLAGPGLQGNDRGYHRRRRRTLLVLLAVRAHRPAHIRWDAGLRRRVLHRYGGYLPWRDDLRRLRLLAVADLCVLLCRWRLRGCRPLRRRGLAVASSHLRHGQRLWFRRHRQGHRAVGFGSGRRQLQRREAGGDAGRDPTRFPLFGKPVRHGRRGLFVLRH
jgi:MFS family permease